MNCLFHLVKQDACYKQSAPTAWGNSISDLPLTLVLFPRIVLQETPPAPLPQATWSEATPVLGVGPRAQKPRDHWPLVPTACVSGRGDPRASNWAAPSLEPVPSLLPHPAQVLWQVRQKWVPGVNFAIYIMKASGLRKQGGDLRWGQEIAGRFLSRLQEERPWAGAAGCSSGDRGRVGGLPHARSEQTSRQCRRWLWSCPLGPRGPLSCFSAPPSTWGLGHHQEGKGDRQSTWAAGLHSPATENDWVLLALVGRLPSVKNQSPAEVRSNPCLCGRRGRVPVVALNLLPPLPSDPNPGWSQGLGRVGGAE